MVNITKGYIAYLRHRANGGVSVQFFLGKWRCVYREFSTLKQKLEFDTEVEARERAKQIRYSDVEADLLQMDNDEVVRCAKFWMNLHG